jgi:type VI secretion system secreted protein VgrG
MGMQIRLWDVLAVIVLLATIVIGVIFATIYSDPFSSLNPFPPPTLPSVLVLPTATNTPYRLPVTWTPVPKSMVGVTDTLAPSSTTLPSSTGFVLPSPTNTNTPTATSTSTSTATSTPTITLSPSATKIPTNTYTFTPRPSATLTSTVTQTVTETISALPTATQTVTETIPASPTATGP